MWESFLWIKGLHFGGSFLVKFYGGNALEGILKGYVLGNEIFGDNWSFYCWFWRGKVFAFWVSDSCAMLPDHGIFLRSTPLFGFVDGLPSELWGQVIRIGDIDKWCWALVGRAHKCALCGWQKGRCRPTTYEVYALRGEWYVESGIMVPRVPRGLHRCQIMCNCPSMELWFVLWFNGPLSLWLRLLWRPTFAVCLSP